MPPEKQKKHPLIESIFGYGNGFITAVITNPLWVLKTYAQQQKTFPWAWSSETIRLLFKGTVANAISQAPAVAIEMGIFSLGYTSEQAPSVYKQHGLAFAGGFCSALVVGPAEKTMNEQHGCNTGLYKALSTSVRKGSLFDGLMACALRDGATATTYLATVPFFRPHFSKLTGLNDFSSSFILSAFFGFVSTVLSQPADAIKTRQQTHHGLSFFSAGRQIIAEQGKKGLVAGLKERVFIVMAGTFLLDQLQILAQKYFQLDAFSSSDRPKL